MKVPSLFSPHNLHQEYHSLPTQNVGQGSEEEQKMLSPRQPLDESVNRIMPDKDDEISFGIKNFDKPRRTVSIRARDSQIQIVRRNIGEEPVSSSKGFASYVILGQYQKGRNRSSAQLRSNVPNNR